MDDKTLRCPECSIGNLSTPLIRYRNDKGRKAKSLPLKYCRFCKILIPLSKCDIILWNEKEIENWSVDVHVTKKKATQFVALVIVILRNFLPKEIQ